MTHEESKLISVHAESVIKYLGCPCEYFPRGTELDTVADKYSKAFSERIAGGYTPLIIVIESHMFFEDDESSSDFQKRIFAAPKIDPEKWFKEKTAEHDRDFCYEPESIIGEIAGGMTRTGFSGIIDYGIKKVGNVFSRRYRLQTRGRYSRGFRSAGGTVALVPRKCFG